MLIISPSHLNKTVFSLRINVSQVYFDSEAQLKVMKHSIDKYPLSPYLENGRITDSLSSWYLLSLTERKNDLIRWWFNTHHLLAVTGRHEPITRCPYTSSP